MTSHTHLRAELRQARLQLADVVLGRLCTARSSDGRVAMWRCAPGAL